MLDNLEIVRLDESRLTDLVGLFSTVFEKEFSIEYLRKKYQPTWFGMMAYSSEGELVSFCGAFPATLSYQGKNVKAVQFGDSMTLKGLRVKGLFQLLGKKLEQVVIDEGYLVHYGFLNQYSYWAYQKKMDWEVFGKMRRHPIKVLTFPKEKMSRLFPKSLPAYHRQVEQILAKLPTASALTNTFQNTNHLYRPHDHAFYQQKISGPYYHLQLEAGAVWTKVGHGLLIGDFNITPGAEQAFFTQLKALARKLGTHRILFQTYEGSSQQLFLEPFIPSLDSWGVGGKSFDPNVPVDQLVLTLGDIDTY